MRGERSIENRSLMVVQRSMQLRQFLQKICELLLSEPHSFQHFFAGHRYSPSFSNLLEVHLRQKLFESPLRAQGGKQRVYVEKYQIRFPFLESNFQHV